MPTLVSLARPAMMEPILFYFDDAFVALCCWGTYWPVSGWIIRLRFNDGDDAVAARFLLCPRSSLWDFSTAPPSNRRFSLSFYGLFYNYPACAILSVLGILWWSFMCLCFFRVWKTHLFGRGNKCFQPKICGCNHLRFVSGAHLHSAGLTGICRCLFCLVSRVRWLLGRFHTRTKRKRCLLNVCVCPRNCRMIKRYS